MNYEFKKNYLIAILSLLFISSINAQNRLEPYKQSIFDDSNERFKFYSKIRNNLYENIHNDYIAPARYIVIPSFHPEYILTFDQGYKEYLLVYTSVKNYTTWDTMDEPNKKSEVYKIKKEVDSTSAKLVILLINKSIKDSRTPKKEHSGYDGTNYYFSNSEQTATIWSPKLNTHTRNLVDIMEEIVALVKDKNVQNIKFSTDLTERIKKLLSK